MFALSLGEWLGTAWGVGLAAVAVAVVLLEATDGHARVDPAPAHSRQAMMTALYLATELDDARTIGEAREKIIEQQATVQREIDEALEKQDSTMLSEMFGDEYGESIERALQGDPSEVDGQEVPSDD
jgi:hypothetical protein